MAERERPILVDARVDSDDPRFRRLAEHFRSGEHNQVLERALTAVQREYPDGLSVLDVCGLALYLASNTLLGCGQRAADLQPYMVVVAAMIAQRGHQAVEIEREINSTLDRMFGEAFKPSAGQRARPN